MTDEEKRKAGRSNRMQRVSGTRRTEELEEEQRHLGYWSRELKREAPQNTGHVLPGVWENERPPPEGCREQWPLWKTGFL